MTITPVHFFAAQFLAAIAAVPALATESEVTRDMESSPADPAVDQVVSYGYRPQDIGDIGSAVSVISADDIAVGQFSFAADALKLAPGVTIARNGAFGGFASARLRGGSSGQTLVVIDGVVVNDAAAPQGGFNFANLDVADIERIEVLRGPQSLVWGADAIGGVIYVSTKDRAPTISAYAEGGSRGTARGGATLFSAHDGAYIRGTVSGVTTDGISRAATGSEPDGYRSLAASVTAGAELSSDARLQVVARVSDSHADIDGFPPPAFAFADTLETEDATEYAVAANLMHGVPDGYEGALSLSFNGIDRSTSDGDIETFTAKGDRANAHYWGSIGVSQSLRITAGGEYERTSAKVSGVDETASAGGIFAMLEANPFKRFGISAGVRRDEFSNFDGATTSRVAAVWTLNDGVDSATRFRASWGQGYRAPTLFELNFNQFGIIPNPDLQAERANGFDVGFEQSIRNAGLSLRATYFRQRVKDQIDFDFAGNGYFNIGRVESEGVELESALELPARIDFRGAYTFVDSKDALSGLPILRTPKHSGSATLTVASFEPLVISATAYFNGRESDFPTPNKAFAKIDIRASYALSKSLEIYGRVENATDADYQDVSGYAEPGASAFAGVRMQL